MMDDEQIDLDDIVPDEPLKPMSSELFIKATRFKGDLYMFVRALDRLGYWDKRPRSFGQKLDHVRRKCQTLKDEKGRRMFYCFRRKRSSGIIESLAVN